MTTKKQADFSKNAEVTTQGIKNRGDPIKGTSTLVTVNNTPMGTLKKRFIAGGFIISLTANAVGLALDWTPDMVHVAYPLATVGAISLVLLFFSKME